MFLVYNINMLKLICFYILQILQNNMIYFLLLMTYIYIYISIYIYMLGNAVLFAIAILF